MWTLEEGIRVKFTSNSAPKIPTLSTSTRVTWGRGRVTRWDLLDKTVVFNLGVASFPSLTRKEGMSFRVHPLALICPLPFRPFCHAAWHLHQLLEVQLRGKQAEPSERGSTSLHYSSGQSQARNQWRAPHGGSDSETAMAWRPAVTHSTSMGELSVELRIPKLFSFLPSFLFFALPSAALSNTRVVQKHVFLIIGSAATLETAKKTRQRGTRMWGDLQQVSSLSSS